LIIQVSTAKVNVNPRVADQAMNRPRQKSRLAAACLLLTLLALRELLAPARLAQADLLALDFAGVAGDETGGQRGLQGASYSISARVMP
jgi:hypothetical protein